MKKEMREHRVDQKREEMIMTTIMSTLIVKKNKNLIKDNNILTKEA